MKGEGERFCKRCFSPSRVHDALEDAFFGNRWRSSLYNRFLKPWLSDFPPRKGASVLDITAPRSFYRCRFLVSIPKGENGSFVRLCLYLVSRGHYFVFCSAAASAVSCAAAAGNELLSVWGEILRSFFVFVSLSLCLFLGCMDRLCGFSAGAVFFCLLSAFGGVVGNDFTKSECSIVERTQYERMMWNVYGIGYAAENDHYHY